VRDESIFGLCEIVCAGVIEFVNDQHAALTAGAGDGDQT
jgi:hypothetical protein